MDNKKTIGDFIKSKMVGQWITNGEVFIHCNSVEVLQPRDSIFRNSLSLSGYIVHVKKGEMSFHYENVEERDVAFTDVFNMWIVRDPNVKKKLNKIVAKHSLLK